MAEPLTDQEKEDLSALEEKYANTGNDGYCAEPLARGVLAGWQWKVVIGGRIGITLGIDVSMVLFMATSLRLALVCNATIAKGYDFQFFNTVQLGGRLNEACVFKSRVETLEKRLGVTTNKFKLNKYFNAIYKTEATANHTEVRANASQACCERLQAFINEARAVREKINSIASSTESGGACSKASTRKKRVATTAISTASTSTHMSSAITTSAASTIET